MAIMPTDEKSRHILEAVRSVLVAKGFAATTINRVAAEAGVSRGLLHYYFKNKEEMLARVIQENMEGSLFLAEMLFLESQTAEQLASGIITALRRVMKDDPDFFSLFFEGWSAARQSPIVAMELEKLYSRFRNSIRQGLEAMIARKRIEPAISLGALSAMVTALIDGLGLQLVTKPELVEDESLWGSVQQGICLLLQSPDTGKGVKGTYR